MASVLDCVKLSRYDFADENREALGRGLHRQGRKLPARVKAAMNHRERKELRAIAAWLKTIRMELPTEPLDIVLHASFYEWAIEILEGKKPGRSKKHEIPSVAFVQMMKRYKEAEASLNAEGHKKPTQALIYKRMRGDGVIGDYSGDAPRKRLERAKAMSDPRFVEEIERFVAHEQAKQPWRWDDFVAREEEQAKQAFDKDWANVKEEIRQMFPKKNPHRYLSNPHWCTDDLYAHRSG